MEFSREILIEGYVLNNLQEENFFLKNRENKISTLVKREIMHLARETIIEIEGTQKEKEVFFLLELKWDYKKISDFMGLSYDHVRQIKCQGEKKILRYCKALGRCDWSFLEILDKEEEAE